MQTNKLKAEVRFLGGMLITINRGTKVRQYDCTLSSFVRLVRLSDKMDRLTNNVFWWQYAN